MAPVKEPQPATGTPAKTCQIRSQVLSTTQTALRKEQARRLIDSGEDVKMVDLPGILLDEWAAGTLKPAS